MPYPSNIHIHHLNAYIYTQRYAMSIETIQFSFVSKSLFLSSERFDASRVAIVPANVSEGAS